MICPRCQTENLSDARFCGQCGAPLPVLCGSCRAINPAENKFCGQCGAELGVVSETLIGNEPHATPRGELRQVTVLFCDLVNSTGLGERVGAEALHELLRRFLNTGIAEVRRYDGTVPQFTGDGFMALFGAPVAQEDHVRRALLAALAIRRAVAGNADALTSDQTTAPIRIGINTGVVVFGSVADKLRMDFTAVGDTANVAARLQEAAEPGSIVISEATLRLARGYARTEPIGALRLKGKSAPVSAFRLVEVSSRWGEFDEIPTFGSRLFVGRDRELAALDQLQRRAERGAGQAIGILGEPGIGKSRLIAEFHRTLAERGVNWIEGRCVSFGTAIPYLLVLDVLRSACRIVDSDTPAAIAEKLRAGLRRGGLDPDADSPLLLDLLGIGGAAPPAEPGIPEVIKARAFNILRQLAINASQRELLVLAVEDLHWIDTVSEEFLGFLSEVLPGAGILLLASYRPGYRPPWIDKTYATQIPLQPLSPEDSRRVLRSVLNRQRLPARLTETILAKAEGNPFFLEQLALHAGEDHGVGAGQSLPETIRDVVMARIDRLPEQTKRLLQIAAVIGREFSLRLLGELWQSRSPPEPHLHSLLQLEFLYERVESGEMTYVFRHALTQDAAYAGLLARDRRHTHAAVGKALEKLYAGRTDEVAELLALHYGQSEEADKAVDYAILAAEKAQRRWANAEALGYFEDALTRLDAIPSTTANQLRRTDAVIKQAEVKFALGHQAEHIEALRNIRAVVEESGDPRRRATWHYWMGFLHSLTGDPPAVAIDHCRQAQAVASAAGFDDLDGFIASALAQAYVVAGEPRAAVDVGERAVAIFEARGNLWWSGRTLGHLANAAVILGEWNGSLKYCRRVLEYGNRLKDLRLKAIGWYRMGCAHIVQGDIEAGLRCCDEALALEATPYDVGMANAYRGYGEIKAGLVEMGIARLEAAVAWFDNSRQRYSQLRVAVWLAEGYLRQGDREKAAPLIDDMLNTSRANGYRYLVGLASWLKGVSSAAEAPAAAVDHVGEAMRILDAIGARNDLAEAMVTRAALWQLSGEIAKARQMLDAARAVFRALGTRDDSDWIKAQIEAPDARLAASRIDPLAATSG
jgi:class 3 adenylate cyclase/tetratricopeptide (TPR) repeat protein